MTAGLEFGTPLVQSTVYVVAIERARIEGHVSSLDLVKSSGARACAQLVALPRHYKRAVLALADFSLLSLALWLALSFRYVTLYVPETWTVGAVLLAAPVIGVATFFYGGVYRVVTRYIRADGTSRLLMYLGFSVLMWALLLLLTGSYSVPRTVVLLYLLLASAFVYGSRQFAGWLLKIGAGPGSLSQRVNPVPVAIYGAGHAGLELLESLRRAGDRSVIGFLDTSPSLVGQYIAGVKVYRPEKLESMIARHGLKQVYLAQSQASRRERAQTLKWLQEQHVHVQVLPAIDDLAAGRVTVSALRPVSVEDLLTRDPVPPVPELLQRAAESKCVMVTGAGGSIGSELVRKLLRQQPRCIVLFDAAETSLYEIDMEARRLVLEIAPAARRPEIVTVLGSIVDEALVSRTIVRYGVETICHAAAYKHVPLVEANVTASLHNNVFGTAVLVDAARKHGVQRFVLISSDKAVRPTNVMGASKRLAELILQANARDPACDCIFTIVRFGNVLDSSGSVMKLFRQQIAAGGPVTVTHKDVIRYFMSIPEAVELVLLAAGMGQGGEVFVLDMGEPVQIDDLARSMIRLAGLEIRSATNPDGDIAIEYVGLRPGEKLYEELLIGGGMSATEHPRIGRSEEPFLPAAELDGELKALRLTMDANDVVAIQAILSRVVEGYRASPSASGESASNTASTPEIWVAGSRTLH